MSKDELPPLIFPSFDMKVAHDGSAARIFDPVRRSWIALTPEEWVRQHCLNWLLQRGYPLGRCSVERRVDGKAHSAAQRFDLLWRDGRLEPFLLIECKAASISINDDTLRQTSWYNLTLKAPYILLTNGLMAFCAHVDDSGVLTPQSDVPDYSLAR